MGKVVGYYEEPSQNKEELCEPPRFDWAQNYTILYAWWHDVFYIGSVICSRVSISLLYHYKTGIVCLAPRLKEFCLLLLQFLPLMIGAVMSDIQTRETRKRQFIEFWEY